MLDLKNKKWELLKLMSLTSSYSKMELIDLLQINLISLLDLIEFINIYCRKQVIYIIGEQIHLRKDFLFFTDEHFQKFDNNFNIKIINSVNSTNDLLMSYVKNNEEINNKIIIANEQINGKGRLNRKWFSSLGDSITFSLGITAEKNIYKLMPITLVVSYSCVNVLRKYGIPAQIKWPNDIVVQQQKLGGVLVSSVKKSLVIGVGLNYNNNNISNSTYIKRYTDCLVKNILKDIIREIYNNMSIFKEDGFNTFKDKYLFYFRDINYDVNILQDDKIQLQGKILGISSQGELILQDNNNFLHYIVSGDLSLRVKTI